MNADEIVLALPARLFKAAPEVQSAQEFLLRASTLIPDGFLVRRGICETDATLRQPIPYIMLRRNVDGRMEYLAYERAGSEGRLHGKLSVGVGGHVNPIDCSASVLGSIMKAARREMAEECGDVFGDFEPITPPSISGLIVMDETEVDRVHVGVLFVVDIPVDILVDVSPDLRNARWMDAMQLRTMLPEMEAWSQAATRDVLGPVSAGYHRLSIDTFTVGELDDKPVNVVVTRADDDGTITIDVNETSPVFQRVWNAFMAADPA